MDLEPEGIVAPEVDSGVGADPVVRDIERLLAEGALEEALAAIDVAARDGRGIPTDLTFLRGDAYLGMGMAREAEQQFRDVLRSDPDCPSSRCWLAMSLFLQWRFEEAGAAAEAARALPDALPDAIVVPTGSGLSLVGLARGFAELRDTDRLRGEPPRLFAVQGEGCAPIARALAAGADDVEPWRDSRRTLAESLRQTIEKFEVEHPRATGILNDILVKLSSMGI